MTEAVPAGDLPVKYHETAGGVVIDGLGRVLTLERTVVNPFGPKSSLRATARYVETALPAGGVAAKPDATATK